MVGTNVSFQFRIEKWDESVKRSTRAGLCAVAVVVLGLFCYALPVHAQGNIHIGKTKVTPKLAYKAEYDDNIYLEENNEKSDYINTVTPGIGFSFEGKRGNYLRAGYEVDLVRYSDYDDNNYESHKATGGFGIKSRPGLYLKVSDRYTDTADPYGSAELYKEGKKTKRLVNTLEDYVGYEFSDRFILEVQYKNFVEEYDLFTDRWQNKRDHVYGGKFYYKLLPKTSFLAEYRRTTREYTEQANATDNDRGITSSTSEDYKLDDYFLGLHWDPTAKLNGDLKFGYSEKSYDNERGWRKRNNYRYSYADKDTWIVETNLQFNASEKTRLRTKIMRSIKESTDVTSHYYTDTTIGLDLNQAVGRRMYVDLGIDYNMARYNAYGTAKAREDNSVTATVGLEYRIRPWLRAGVEYGYRRKECSEGFEYREYTNHKGTIRLGAVF